ncbi:MAG: tRNA pseudouridine(55) synthase TruB [Myxococcota bacterium]
MGRRRSDDPAVCGVLLVDKPAGPTSHDVVGWVRRSLRIRRVGHCGTLDPAATGLLVVAVGAATKLVPYLTGQDKRYRAGIVLGRSTTTADAQGETIAEEACPAGLEAEVPAALEGLRGTQQLAPPAYSAVHVDGKRAHELARAGETPQLATRPMTVHDVELHEVTRRGTEVEVSATLAVSKGTYIRSLAEALGERLGVPAHLGALHRISSGEMALAHERAVRGLHATPMEPGPKGQPRWRIEGPDDSQTPQTPLGPQLATHLLPPADVVPLPLLRVGADEHGQRALRRLASGQAVALADPGLPAWEGPDAKVAVAPATPDRPGLMIVQVANDGNGAQLRPERIVVPPAGCS